MNTPEQVRAWASRPRDNEHDAAQQQFWRMLPILPTDYANYGGQVERWARATDVHADCSSGCKHARFLEGSGDWLVCANPNGPRFGLLTWEHQAGADCFEAEDTDDVA